MRVPIQFVALQAAERGLDVSYETGRLWASDRPLAARRALTWISAAAVVNALQPEDAGDAHPVHYFSTSDQTPFQLVHGAVVRN